MRGGETHELALAKICTYQDAPVPKSSSAEIVLSSLRVFCTGKLSTASPSSQDRSRCSICMPFL